MEVVSLHTTMKPEHQVYADLYATCRGVTDHARAFKTLVALPAAVHLRLSGPLVFGGRHTYV
jgi:hypothetical protein